MADIKPIGIDQTTGRKRAIESNDTVVDNVGDQIEIVVKQVYDYSGNTRNNVQILFPWSSTPEKLDDPASIATTTVGAVAWSPNGEFLATNNDFTVEMFMYQRIGTTLTKLDTSSFSALPPQPPREFAWSPNGEFLAAYHDTTPFITVYQRDGTTFTKLSDPASLPNQSGSGTGGTAWSPNGEYLVVSYIGGNKLTIYRRDETTLTKIADPSTLPTSNASGTNWSPNGEFFAVSHGGFPYVSIYQQTGIDEFTKLPDPASAPTNTGNYVRWSPNGEFLAFGGSTAASQFTNALIIYQRSGTTFTKVTQSGFAQPPSSVSGIAWSPNSKYVAAAHGLSPFITIYERSGTSFTKLANPASLPPGTGRVIDWTSNGEFLTIGHSSTPFITTYQTDQTLPESGVVFMRGVLKED